MRNLHCTTLLMINVLRGPTVTSSFRRPPPPAAADETRKKAETEVSVTRGVNLDTMGYTWLCLLLLLLTLVQLGPLSLYLSLDMKFNSRHGNETHTLVL